MRFSRRLCSALPPSLRTLLTDPPLSKELVIQGWLKSVRQHKNVSFAEIEDGTGGIQGVWKGKGKLDGLTSGSSVRLRGQLAKSKGQGQAYEFLVDETTLLGGCDPETYPIQKQHLPPAYLRDHAHLRFKTAQMAAVVRVRDGLMRDWHDWYEDNEFTMIHTPILTSSDCEGAGETFALKPIYSAHPADESAATASSPGSESSQATGSGVSQAAQPCGTAPAAAHPPTPFFPTPPNLTVSAQLHLEPPTHALSRTYTLSPCFRAEPSQTSRHLSEFYMMEAEVAFVDTLDRLLDVVEDGMRVVLRRLLWGEDQAAQVTADSEGVAAGTSTVGRPGRAARIRDDLQTIYEHADLLEGREDRPPLAHILNASSRPFARLTYTEAVELLQRAARENSAEADIDDISSDTGVLADGRTPLQPLGGPPPTWGESLSTEQEKWLANHYDGPVFVTHYPRPLKPFYMLASSADSSFVPPERLQDGTDRSDTVACFDLLFPGIGEMAGGSLREHRMAELEASIAEAGLNKEAYEWYLDLRRYGSVPHGGWGMGWERWVCWVTGVNNIRDVVAYPRWRGNCRY